MKRILTILSALLVTLSMGAQTKKSNNPAVMLRFAGNDPHVTYVGRTAVDADGNVSFDWSATTIRVEFEGDYLALQVSDTKKNYYNVWIDKDPDVEADKVIATEGTDTVVEVVTKDMFDKKTAKGPHKVTIQKRTEGEQGRTTIKKFFTHGQLLQAEPLKDRIIEVIGDSYTCGYGSENSTSKTRFSPETENINKAYISIIARYFDADLVAVAHSGMGITRNYNEEMKPHLKGYHMVERYLQTYDEDKEVMWDAKAAGWKPDITVIYLGANDFSVSKQPSLGSFKTKYHRLLQQIKANYGEDHPILCCATRNDEGIFNYVREAANTCGLKNVRYTAIFQGVQFNDDRELGADSHPNYKAHIKTAHVLMPYVATLAEWDMTGKPIK